MVTVSIERMHRVSKTSCSAWKAIDNYTLTTINIKYIDNYKY